MESFLYSIYEYTKNYCPYLFYLFTSENRIVYFIVFTLAIIILALLTMFLIDTILDINNIFNFIKYKKACDSEIKKNTDNNYMFTEKKSFSKSLILISLLVLFIILGLSIIFLIMSSIGLFIRANVSSFTIYIITSIFIAILIMILYPLSTYWFVKLIFKISSYINEKYVQFIRPSFRIKKGKRRRRKHDQ